MFHNAKICETGLSNLHKLVGSLIKLSYMKDHHTCSSVGTIKSFQMSI